MLCKIIRNIDRRVVIKNYVISDHWSRRKNGSLIFGHQKT